jgi:hypothetical protein
MIGATRLAANYYGFSERRADFSRSFDVKSPSKIEIFASYFAGGFNGGAPILLRS